MAKAVLAESSRRLRHHAADRRAAGRSDRHGAAGQRPELRSHHQHVRRTAQPAHPGRRNGHRKGQADGRVRPRRGDLPRFDHPPGPRLEHRSPALRQDPLRRRRRQRPAASQAVLRRRPQRRRRRQPDDRRHRPGRHRQQDGRSDLRRVQRHRQHGAAPRPPHGREAHLAGHRRQPAPAPAAKNC